MLVFTRFNYFNRTRRYKFSLILLLFSPFAPETIDESATSQGMIGKNNERHSNENEEGEELFVNNIAAQLYKAIACHYWDPNIWLLVTHNKNLLLTHSSFSVPKRKECFFLNFKEICVNYFCFLASNLEGMTYGRSSHRMEINETLHCRWDTYCRVQYPNADACGRLLDFHVRMLEPTQKIPPSLNRWNRGNYSFTNFGYVKVSNDDRHWQMQLIRSHSINILLLKLEILQLHAHVQ